jgi:hypothetical protein
VKPDRKMLIDKDGNETLLAIDMTMVKRSDDHKRTETEKDKSKSPDQSPRDRKKSHHSPKRFKDEDKDSMEVADGGDSPKTHKSRRSHEKSERKSRRKDKDRES